MTQSDLQPVVARLVDEFDILPASMVQTCVALAATPAATASGSSAVESTARADLVELAGAATRRAMAGDAA